MADSPSSLIPGNAYAAVPVARDMQRNFEEQTGIPIDGSNADLRNLSPFTMSFVLPDIYAAQDSPRPSDSLVNAASDVFSGVAARIASTLSGDFSQEANRQREESGLNGPSQSRTKSRSINSATVSLVDVANKKSNSFQEYKEKRRKQVFSNSSSLLGGRGRNSTSRERFTYQGEQRFSTDNRESSPELGITDLEVAIDIATQLETLANVPPLTLLINPNSLSITYTMIQQFTERTRYGYVYQGWGTDQAVLSISGKTGAFISGAPSNFALQPGQTELPFVSGVQFASKLDSAAWQNFANLLTMYKNNGYIYDTLGESFAMHAVGSIAIEYDGWTYVGNMNSFEYSYNEDTTQNGGIEFTFEFTANRIFYKDDPSVTVQPMVSPSQSPSNLRDVEAGSFNPDSIYDTDPETGDTPEVDEEGGPLAETFFGAAELTSTAFRAGSNSVPRNSGGFQ